MKSLRSWKKSVLAAALAGTAAFMIGTAPFAVAQAAETTDAAAGASTRVGTAAQMPPMRPFGPELRIKQMVQQGKITSEQAEKLKKAIADFHEKQEKDHQKFIKSLPSKTGISETTLQELMAPPRIHRGKGQGPQQRLQQLVKDGSVTEKEAAALEQAFKNHQPQAGQLSMQGQRPDRQQMEKQLSEETGISTSRLQEIMKLLHPQRPQGDAPQEA